MRLCIIGGPKAGKTTLARRLSPQFDGRVWSTDDLIAYGWDGAKTRTAKWLERPDPWCIEGVVVPRALRHWMREKGSRFIAPPVDHIVVVHGAQQELSEGQRRMATGVMSVWHDIAPTLVRLLPVSHIFNRRGLEEFKL